MNEVKILPEVMEFLANGHSHFINGVLTKTGADSINIENPATEEIIATLLAGEESEVEAAVESAYEAFNGSWKNTSPENKQNILNTFSDLIEQNTEILAQIETLCTGKNINIARYEMSQTVSFIRYYAGWATKLSGETLQPSLPSENGSHHISFTIREPVGVVGAIVPWNFPVMIAIWKIAAALACGCTIVVKPSVYTPLSLLFVAKLAFDAGLPAGVFNVVNGSGRIVGDGLIKHPHVSKISFTGSVPTGIEIGKEAINANLTRFTLELGGKNAAAFFDDMTAEEITQGIIDASMVHQGQICASIERAYIHKSKINDVIKLLPSYLEKIKIGSPLDESAFFGTLSNKEQYDRVLASFQRSRDEGDEIVYGAYLIGGKGYYVPPTVVLAKNPKSSLMCEEVFGSFVSIYPFETEEELVSLMNDTPFGLTASVWTKDLSRVFRMVSKIKTGTLWINTHLTLDPSTPFGGVKSSGIGREFGSAFIESYTELKSIIVRY